MKRDTRTAAKRRRHRLAGWLTGLGLVVSLASPGLARADRGRDTERAREWYTIAMQAMQARDYEAAAQAFDQALKYHDDPVLLYNAGRAYERAGRQAVALARYKACIIHKAARSDVKKRAINRAIALRRFDTATPRAGQRARVRAPTPAAPSQGEGPEFFTSTTLEPARASQTRPRVNRRFGIRQYSFPFGATTYVGMLW